MGPFARFTVAFVVVVLVGFAGFLYWREKRVAAPVATRPIEDPAQPRAIEPPPEVAGLNYGEVSVPGSKIQAAAPTTPKDYVEELTARKLAMPIGGFVAKDLYDSFNDVRGEQKHEATDLPALRGTPVHAIDEGNIVKLFNSKKGGLTIYEFDDAQRYCFYYAHLDRYADGVREGMLVRPGDVIAYVGSTGDANAENPHLHFAISLLDPDKKYWKGTPLNPYPVLLKVARP